MDREADRDASKVRIGAHIRTFREARHWTRPALAKRAGISISTLRRWEEGLNEVGVTGALALASAFGMDLPTLLGQHAEEPPRQEKLRASDVQALVAFAAAIGTAAEQLSLVASPGLRYAVAQVRESLAAEGGGQAGSGE